MRTYLRPKGSITPFACRRIMTKIAVEEAEPRST